MIFKLRNSNNIIQWWIYLCSMNVHYYCSHILGYNFPFYISIIGHIHANKLWSFNYFPHIYLGIYIFIWSTVVCFSFQDEYLKLRHSVEGMDDRHKTSTEFEELSLWVSAGSMSFNYIVNELKKGSQWHEMYICRR